MNVLSVINLKGGVGKTTLLNNIAGVLAKYGYRVLLCDMDRQGNLTMAHMEAESLPEIIELVRQRGGLTKVLLDDAELDDVIIQSPTNENIWIATADMELENVERNLKTPKDLHSLKVKLGAMQNRFDHVLIDCPPSPGVSTQMALTASNCYLVPLNTHPYSYIGADQVARLASAITDYGGNPDLKFLGYVISRVMSNRKLTESMIAFFREEFGDQVLRTEIKESTKYGQATTNMKTITDFDPTSEPARIIEELVAEIGLIPAAKINSVSTL